MHQILLYMLKTIVCSGVLTVYYWLALKNNTFHRYNRFYLLGVVILSLTIPLISIKVGHTAAAPAPVIKLLEVIDVPGNGLDDNVYAGKAGSFGIEQLLWYCYVFVGIVLLMAFLLPLLKMYRLARQNEKLQLNNICIIQTTAEGTPYSFFKWIFWNSHIDFNNTAGRQILQHEIAHVEQKHSHDKVFLSLVAICCWYNPFFWIIRRELSMIHEFTADKAAIGNADTAVFAAMILQAAYPQHRFELSNSFFYSPIKRRLIMISKNTQKKAGYISRMLVLPLAAIVFAAFTLKPQKTVIPKQYSGKKITVVIDAGHGGHDAGATDGNGLFEKNISLAIAKKIKALNSNDDIAIVLTRETDKYQSPKEKADFINTTKADLAIILHMDAAVKDSFDIKSGLTAWVAKNEFPNAEASKIAASVLLQLFSKNYSLKVNPAPLQRPNGIWVLQNAECPAVLIEAGYMTNKKDAAFLGSAEGQEMIAKNILAAIEQYAVLEKSDSLKKDTESKQTTPAAATPSNTATKTVAYRNNNSNRAP